MKTSTLPTKVCLVKAMAFPVVMYGCESWTVKKAERRRIDAFELWCWRRLLRVPWTARRSNQSILKEISPEISMEGMMLKLKLQYFGQLMRRVGSLEKTLMLGGIGGRSPAEAPAADSLEKTLILGKIESRRRSSSSSRPPCPSPFPEFTQTHVHRVRDAIQPTHPLSSPSAPTPNPSQHQSLFQ